jgi:hypothetical protein
MKAVQRVAKNTTLLFAARIIICAFKRLLAGLGAGGILYAARSYNFYLAGLAGCFSHVLFLFLFRSFTPRDRVEDIFC